MKVFLTIMNPQEPHTTIQLGKKGITPELLNQLKQILNTYKLVKIKFLKSSMEQTTRKELAKKINDLLNLEVEQKLIGNTLFLKKNKKINYDTKLF